MVLLLFICLVLSKNGLGIVWFYDTFAHQRICYLDFEVGISVFTNFLHLFDLIFNIVWVAVEKKSICEIERKQVCFFCLKRVQDIVRVVLSQIRVVWIADWNCFFLLLQNESKDWGNYLFLQSPIQKQKKKDRLIQLFLWCEYFVPLLER